MDPAKKLSEEEINAQALAYHSLPDPGKFHVITSKPMNNTKDLSLAYSPGVAAPCLAIAKDPELAYKYTNKGNMCACVSNGTAVLGLGNIGALASKPVMEGKAVLFKKMADVECIDLCIDATDPEEFINCVKFLGPTFGALNLEDIKGPECFYIEKRLKELMSIPVFHDDQHGTAIVCLSGLINACQIYNKDIKDLKIVCNGAGAAGIACMNLIKLYGCNEANMFVCDTKGVIWPGRKSGMNDFKMTLANATIEKDTTLLEIAAGADVLIGVSAPKVFTEEMVLSLAPNPIIFAMANPEPEIRPELAQSVRSDCIIATGRSDYPNQINNVMCFPYLFRATLDTRSSQINEEMKMAAALALAEIARDPEVPESVKKAAPGRSFEFGRDYIIPNPYDPRIIERLPVAIAKAAMESGVAKVQITDFEAYAAKNMQRISNQKTYWCRE